MKIWFNDVGRVVVESDEEQVTMSQDIAMHLIEIGAHAQYGYGDHSGAGQPDLLAALKAEAER